MRRNILISTLPLVVSILLIIIVAKFGLGKVSSLRKEISQSSKDRATLIQKLNTLSSLGADLQSNSQLSSYALPDKNPALATLSQLKSLATQNLVSLSKIKSGGGGEGSTKGISTASLTFEVLGPKEGVLTFLESLSGVAPITRVEKVKFSEQGDQIGGSVTVISYYAPYPTKLPAITATINDLTNEEIKTLTSIVKLTPPQFVSLSPSSTAGKVDPFSQ